MVPCADIIDDIQFDQGHVFNIEKNDVHRGLFEQRQRLSLRRGLLHGKSLEQKVFAELLSKRQVGGENEDRLGFFGFVQVLTIFPEPLF